MTPSSATKSERKFVELNVSRFPQETFNSEITNKKKNNTDEGLYPHSQMANRQIITSTQIKKVNQIKYVMLINYI